MATIVIIWGLIILFILQPGISHEGAEFGAQLFIHALLPYLLPYIILTQWLLKIPYRAKQNSKWRTFTKAYILGSFGGFPVGAVTVSEMKKNGELTKRQSGLLLAACHAPGPMFVIGFVGTELFGNVGAGWKLLAAIHLSNILFFLLTLLFLRKDESQDQITIDHGPRQTGLPLLDAIKESSSIIILVATTVIFFSSLGTVLSSVATATFTVDLGIAKTIALSIFEMTSGVQSATDHFYDSPIFPFLIAAILSLNGMSIHMQVFVIANAARVPMSPYILGRLWSIILVPFLFYLFY
ncbi:hypothetical protein AB1K83_01890 [Sporosarcina sp. 179-K 3D1 HS]|uniref:hypothetical protein n=1 Tax=Sporosarcina sp. 179-K 3D1 HS TaxID=3232169 RepID=UPI00399FE798